MREADDIARIVTVQILAGAWRVCAAHMEPLCFRSAAEAERAGRRVARTLARLGFDARLDVHDDAGVLTCATPYPAETEPLDVRPPFRRQLHS